MIAEEIEFLLSDYSECTCTVNGVSDAQLQDIDDILLKNKHNISDETFAIYKKFIPMKSNIQNEAKSELFDAMQKYMKECFNKEKYFDSLLIARFLLVKYSLPSFIFNDIAEIFAKISRRDYALEFINLYTRKETNKPLLFLTLANFYNIHLKDYKTAIKYYENYLRIDETKTVIFTILGSLYAKAYGDFSLKDQIYYYERAYKLNSKDNLVLFSLALAYEKMDDKFHANKYYLELIENNPTNQNYYNYGAFLISCGDLKNGYKYLTHRFNVKNNINLKYPIADSISKKWNFKTNISKKTLLVHYEQGFGDTFMYCRFVPFLKGIAKNVIFVVQYELYELIKNSKIFENIEIVSDKTNLSEVLYDYDMALLDVPYVLGITASEIPFTQGYLVIDDNSIEDYKNKYLKKSENLKVGIAFKGSESANYSERDIEFSKFKQLLNIDNIDFYSFTSGAENNDKITNLEVTFDSFTKTACALKNMDIVISTDNVILNLAGALGVRTYGLFNKYPNFRWYKTDGENVGWYDSVIPLKVKDKDYWSPVIDKLYNILTN